MRYRQTGFTLLEIMVVIAIIGLSVSLILGTNNGDAQKLISVKKSLENLFAIARNQAFLTHSTIVWQADEKGFKFSVMQIKEGESFWNLEEINRKNLKAKKWQHGISWAYAEEDGNWRMVTHEESKHSFSASDDDEQEEDATYLMPVRIMFSADGRVVPALPIRLYLNDKQVELKYGSLPKPNDESEVNSNR